MAVTRMETPVCENVRFQQEPHSADPKPAIAEEPPMLGKVGKLPNVGNREERPFGPFEQATVFISPDALSYVLSYDARSAALSPARKRVKTMEKNCMFDRLRGLEKDTSRVLDDLDSELSCILYALFNLRF